MRFENYCSMLTNPDLFLEATILPALAGIMASLQVSYSFVTVLAIEMEGGLCWGYFLESFCFTDKNDRSSSDDPSLLLLACNAGRRPGNHSCFITMG